MAPRCCAARVRVRTERHSIVFQNFGYLLPQMESMGIDRRRSEEATTALLRLRKAENQVDTVQISFGEVEREADKEPSVRNCIRETEFGPAEGEEAKATEVHRRLGGEQWQERHTKAQATFDLSNAAASTATTFTVPRSTPRPESR